MSLVVLLRSIRGLASRRNEGGRIVPQYLGHICGACVSVGLTVTHSPIRVSAVRGASLTTLLLERFAAPHDLHHACL